MTGYAWLITVDLIGQGSDVGVRGPRAADEALLQRLSRGEGVRFRLRDDDGILYYEGRLVDDGGGNDLAPLDDFGMPYAGCTGVELCENGRWEVV